LTVDCQLPVAQVTLTPVQAAATALYSVEPEAVQGGRRAQRAGTGTDLVVGRRRKYVVRALYQICSALSGRCR